MTVALAACAPASSADGADTTTPPETAAGVTATVEACGLRDDVEDSPAEFRERALCEGTALVSRSWTMTVAATGGEAGGSVHTVVDTPVDLHAGRARGVMTISAQPEEFAAALGEPAVAVETVVDAGRMFLRPLDAGSPYLWWELPEETIGSGLDAVGLAAPHPLDVSGLLSPLQVLAADRAGESPGTYLVPAVDAVGLLQPSLLDGLGGADAVVRAGGVARAVETVYPGNRRIQFDLTPVVHAAASTLADSATRDVLLAATHTHSYQISQLGTPVRVEPPSAEEIQAGPGWTG